MAQFAPQTHEAAMMGGLGALSGNVTDPSGGVIANAQVRIYSETGGLVASRITDAVGNYRVEDLPAGNYRAEFGSPGFKNMTVRRLQVGGGSAQNQNARLQVGSATETVTVEAEASRVQAETATLGTAGGRLGTSSELGGLIGPASGRAVPLAGRNYSQVETVRPDITAPTTEVLNAGGFAGGRGRRGSRRHLPIQTQRSRHATNVSRNTIGGLKKWPKRHIRKQRCSNR